MASGTATPGCLYVVATPIGHLDDITLRAVDVLKRVATIAAEDTRHTRTLLRHLGIAPPRLISLHEHNEVHALRLVLEALEAGDVALVSDAGTPLVSDPGFELLRAVWQAGGRVVPVPGASALTAALSASPIPANDVTFAGFLPSKPGPLARRLDAFAGFPGAVVFFEAPHRVVATVAAIAERFPDRDLFVGRELTKVHETLLFGPAAELLPVLEAEHRGEFVLMLAPGEASPSVAGDELVQELAGLLPPRKAARVIARLCGGDTRGWYDKLVAKASDGAVE